MLEPNIVKILYIGTSIPQVDDYDQDAYHPPYGHYKKIILFEYDA